MRFLIAMALACSGCEFEVPDVAVTPGTAYAIGASGTWTDSERTQLAGACADWGRWTDGALSCRLAEPGEDVDVTFVKGATGTGDFGKLFIMARREIVIDAEGMQREGFGVEAVRRMADNLLGQAAAMPLHESAGVLSREDIAAEFTAADRDSCRSVGFCR